MKKVKIFLVILLATMLKAATHQTAIAKTAQKPIELRLAHMFNVGSPSHALMERWAQKITADSKGRLTIRIFPVNTLLSVMELYNGVAKGAADISFGFRYPPKGYTLGVTFPTILGGSDIRISGRVYDDVWKEFPDIMAEEWKEVKVLWLAPSQFSHLGSVKPVHAPSDLKGMQIRVPSREMGDLIKDMGGTPVSMSVPDYVVALEKGTVDGSTSMSGAIHDNRLAGKGKLEYVLDFGFGVAVPIMAIMNKDSYNRLPADLRGVIDKSCQWGKEQTIDYWARAYEDDFTYFKTAGAEIVRPSPQARAQFKSFYDRMREKVGKDLDAKGYPGTKIVQFIIERETRYSR